MASERVGIWLIGARGGIGVTTATGLAALRQGLTDSTGLVSCLPQFSGLDFLGWDQLVLGGHEIRKASLAEEAAKIHRESRVFETSLLAACHEDLEAIDARIRPGTLYRVGKTIHGLSDIDEVLDETLSPRAMIDKIQADLSEFASSENLARVVVVNLASTEPPIVESSIPERWEALAPLLENRDSCPLPASTLYAIAAFELGHAYVNFTPSIGSSLPAMEELAVANQTCHAGRDGKTGETLLKSVLAPMFAARNLHVMSWVGHNIFGNMDGKVLDDPQNKATKVASKDKLLGQILGYDPTTHVSIEYIESLADWKTAWDHIHFRGFLNTPMTLQFTWQGCDSLLAAPLVLDLVRFTDLAHRREAVGALTYLGSFFKSPLGDSTRDFGSQFQALLDWSQQVKG